MTDFPKPLKNSIEDNIGETFGPACLNLTGLSRVRTFGPVCVRFVKN